MVLTRFFVIGILGCVVDFLFFQLLLLFKVELLVARLLAFWVAMGFTWFGNRLYTFRVYGAKLAQFARHVLSSHAAGLMNLSAFYLVSLSQSSQIAFLLGVILGAKANYLLSKMWVFVSATQQDASADRG